MKAITIAGNCTKDAELRTTQGGQKVAGFSVAVNDYENGEKTTEYFDVSLWGKRGESAMQFATKGAKICVTGKLGRREYNGKTYLTVNASDFTPMGGSQGDNNQSSQRDSSYGAPAPSRDLGDEIPFSPEWRI